MGVRKVVNNRFKSIFLFPSVKLKRQVWADSPLEHDYIHLLEPDSEVSYYEGQPLKICYTLRGEKRVRTYTPDFLVRRGNKIQIVEVKLQKDIQDERIQLIFRIATRACMAKGCEFVVATEETIRLQPRLDNLKMCWRYATTPISLPRYRFYCRELFNSEAEAPLCEVIRYFESKNVSRRVVYAFLYWGVLAVDFMKPLNQDSLVSLPLLTAVKEASNG